MTRKLISIAAVLIGGLLQANTASAQEWTPPNSKQLGNIYQRPTISPYLQLLQRNQNGSTNYGAYQSMVRPQVEFNDQMSRLQNRAVNEPYNRGPQQAGPGFQVRSPATTGAAVGVQPTGHATTSMNYSHFYNNRGRR